MKGPSTELVRLEGICATLAEVVHPAEVKLIGDKAAAVEEFLKRSEYGSQAHALAWELIQRCNRRLGELLRELSTAQGERTDLEEPRSTPGTKSDQLKSLNISRTQAHRFERLAAIPEQEFDGRVHNGREDLAEGKPVKNITAPTSATDHDPDSWGTPVEVLEAARKLLGSIELDPASNAQAQQRVKAARFYTKEDNGLEKSWKCTKGGLWLNPPFSSPLISQFSGRWVDLCGVDYRESLLLTNSDTSTDWLHNVVRADKAVCFTKRLPFLGPDGKPVKGNRSGQAISYHGEKLPLFRKLFSEFGEVMVRA